MRRRFRRLGKKRRQEKAAKRYSNAKVRPQDEVDWDLEKQEAEPFPGVGTTFQW